MGWFTVLVGVNGVDGAGGIGGEGGGGGGGGGVGGRNAFLMTLLSPSEPITCDCTFGSISPSLSLPGQRLDPTAGTPHLDNLELTRREIVMSVHTI